MESPKRKYHVTNLFFFTVTPLIAVAGLVWLYRYQGGPHWATWVLTVVCLYAGGLGITAGYHRLYAHRSYDAPWPVRLLLLLFGGAAFEGSVRDWSSDHRAHHRHVDTDRDPYNIKKGFWHAHIGWVIREFVIPRDHSYVKDIDQDPVVRFQHCYYLPLAIGISFILPMAIASLWGDPWGGLFLAGFARMVFNHHATFCINSFCHFLGKQPYSKAHSGRDSWITALFTYGEGYHNFHHEFPGDYRNGLENHHFDPGKWLIAGLARLGWAKNLRRAEPRAILQAKWQTQETEIPNGGKILILDNPSGF